MWTDYSLDWDIDGERAATDSVGFQHPFKTAGGHQVALHVDRVDRSFGIRERGHVTDGTLTLTVQDVGQASNEMLEQMRPGTSTLPATRDLEQSLVSSIHELERHAADGGEQRDYWVERLRVQRE